MATIDTTPIELARAARGAGECGKVGCSELHPTYFAPLLPERTSWLDTPPVALASLALAPRGEDGEVIGEGW